MLAELAEHSAWANARVIEACCRVDRAKLTEELEGYDSVMGILRHLVQVSSNFYQLAHAREREQLDLTTLERCADACRRVDRQFVEYARSLDPARAESESFLVPWFGFKITRAEGILQPLTHAHKHRSDISMQLPRLGGQGVEMDLIQWLDESRGSGA